MNKNLAFACFVLLFTGIPSVSMAENGNKECFKSGSYYACRPEQMGKEKGCMTKEGTTIDGDWSFIGYYPAISYSTVNSPGKKLYYGYATKMLPGDASYCPFWSLDDLVDRTTRGKFADEVPDWRKEIIRY